MYPWKARHARIHVPGDAPSWCIDNGEGDLIACGTDEPGKERAHKLADTLNLGDAANAKDRNLKSMVEAVKALQEKCAVINQLAQHVLPAGMRRSDENSDRLYVEIGELQRVVDAFQQALRA